MIKRLFVCGPARHGKDSVCEMLQLSTGFTFASSSMFALNLFLRQGLKDKYGIEYDSPEECFADRGNKRNEWYSLICDYNKDDPTRMACRIFSEHQIYCGIRDRIEFLAGRDLADLSIWVDAGTRVSDTSESAFSHNLVRKEDCDVTLDNSGTLDDLRYKVERLCKTWY